MTRWRLAALLLGAALTLACASPRHGASVGGDVLARLPGGAEAMAALAPYRFAERGVGWLLALEPPSTPAARLAQARALVDALLYGELAQDEAALEALALADHWARVEALLAPAPEAGQEVSEALAQGRALVGWLRHRRLDADYHRGLRALAEGDGLWSAQARVARLLDLDEALWALEEVPPGQRLGALVEALGGGVCDDPGALASLPRGEPGRAEALAAACPLRCAQGRAPEGVEPWRADLIAVAACGHDGLPWPVGVHEGLYSAELAVALRLLGDADTAVETLRLGGAPLVRAAEPALVGLRQRLTARPLALALPIDHPEGLGAGVGLARGLGKAGVLDAGIHYAVIHADGLRLGLGPVLAAAQGGRVEFLEARAGMMGYPGQLVVTPGADARQARRAVREGAERLREVAARLGAPVGAEVRWPVLIDARTGLDEVAAALEALRLGVGAGRLPVSLVLWSETGAVGRSLALVPPGRAGGLEDFPEGVRPLDLEVEIGQGQVRLVAAGVRGQPVGSGLDAQALEREAAALAAAHPDQRAATVRLLPGAGGNFAALVGLLDALSRAGFEVALLSVESSP